MNTNRVRSLIAAAAAGLLLLTACADSPQADGGQELPKISGSFGDTPEYTWPNTGPSGELQVEVLEEGDGDVVTEGALVVANYAGHVWGSDEPFDSSFERPEPSQFPLNGVVRGWQEGIPGHTVGSRLLVSIPPELGYGSAGRPEAGIGGEDTMVFVIDLIATFDIDTLGDPDAAPVDLPTDLPVTVDGDLGERVTVTVDDGAQEPTRPEAYALSTGEGKEVGDGDSVVIAYTLTSWDNEVTESSWMPELGPDAGPVTIRVGDGTALDLIGGHNVGSRVLMTQIAAGEMPPLVIVADILAAF